MEELLRYHTVMYYNETDIPAALLVCYRSLPKYNANYVRKRNLKIMLSISGDILRIKERQDKKEAIDFFEKEPLFIDKLFGVWF